MANYFNTLHNAYGQPAVAVLVRMHDHYTGELVATTHTNKWGQFSFASVNEGTYDFRLYGENFTEADWIYEVHIIDAVDNSGRTQNLDKTTGNFVSRGFETEEILINANLGTVSAKNVARSIFSRTASFLGTGEAITDYDVDSLVTSPYTHIGFYTGETIDDWYPLALAPYVKFPGENYIIAQAGLTTNGQNAAVDVELFLLGGSGLNQVLISGITYSGTYGAPLFEGDSWTLSMNLSGLTDYASYLVGLRGKSNFEFTTPPTTNMAKFPWLSIHCGSEFTYNVSGIYSPGDPEAPPSGGGGKPPPPIYT